MARRILSIDEQHKFEIDDGGQLYWQGERVLTEVKLSLPWAVNMAVFFASLATVGTFALTGLQLAGFVGTPSAVIVNIDKHVLSEEDKQGSC